MECGAWIVDPLSLFRNNLQLTKTMISFSIIFSCIHIVISGTLEEKHLVFDDPIHGPHDRLCSMFSHLELSILTSVLTNIRLYLQFLPSSYSEDLGPWPLVLDFHGFTMTAEEQRQYSKWDVLAEEEGFIAVFPEGVPDSPSELRNAKTDGCWEFKQTFRSWNINDDSGVFGDVCDRDR